MRNKKRKLGLVLLLGIAGACVVGKGCFNSKPREYGLEEYMTIDLHNMQKLEKNRWSGEYMGETYHLKVDEENERITLYK